jgi:lipopolysaccharide transport system ATP-binding protein
VNKASVLVLASHSPELISRVCNSQITLEHGRVIDSVNLTQARTIGPELGTA